MKGYRQYMTSGALLKAIRINAQKTQAQAAEECEVTLRTWERWEADERAVSLSAVKLFCLLNRIEPNAVLVALKEMREEERKE